MINKEHIAERSLETFQQYEFKHVKTVLDLKPKANRVLCCNLDIELNLI